MPTRTVRMQATTFLEKLSRHNAIRKSMSHAKLDEHLQLFPEVTGVPKGANRKNKQEYLAATNFLVYHGNDEARMQALSDEELQTLNTMFSHSRSVDRDDQTAARNKSKHEAELQRG